MHRHFSHSAPKEVSDSALRPVLAVRVIGLAAG